MTWTHHLSDVLKHVPHMSGWFDLGLIVSAFTFLFWDNRRRHRILATRQVIEKPLITDQDPQVILEIKNQEFADDLELHTDYNRPLIFNNRGMRDAMKVTFSMKQLNEGWAECEEIPVIKRDEKRLILPHIKGPNGDDIAPFQEFSLEMLLESEWRHVTQVRQLAGLGPGTQLFSPTLEVPIKITYQDHNKNAFSTEQTMVYYYDRNGTKGYIEFTAPDFTRL